MENKVLPFISIAIFDKKTAEKLINSKLFHFLVISLVVISLYYSSCWYHFATEDFSFIERVKNNFNFYDIFVFSFFESSFYRPMAFIFYAISFALFNLNSTGYKIIIIALFITNNFFVYELVEKLIKRKTIAFFAAIVYATRGAHAISLYWIAAGFQETTMSFFVLCSLLLYVNYINNRKIRYYIISLLCSILALLAKESGIIVPILILLIELCDQQSISYFSLKILIRRIIPFCVITLIYALLYILRLQDIDRMISEGYRMNASLDVVTKNLVFYISHAFNSRVEGFILCILIISSFLNPKDRKKPLISIIFFLAGLLPVLFLVKHSKPYYLSVSLIGFSLLLSIGIKNIYDKFPSIKYMLISMLLFIMVVTLYNHNNHDEYLDNYFKIEQETNNVLSYLKHKFPSFPNGSVIYIKGANWVMWWFLSDGAAIRLNYNTNISTYFEGVTTTLPTNYSHIYYFEYNKHFSFIGDSIKS